MTLVSGTLPASEQDDDRLLAQVHPPDWSDPVPKRRYDLLVLGAGTGGLVCAAGAAGLGARVALIEEHRMGGDCLNTGCVPSKALIASARAWRAAGGAMAGGGADGFLTAMSRMRRLRADLSPADGAPRFAALGVDVFLGRGRFEAPDRIGVNGKVLRFRRAVIATGARPRAPTIPGLHEVGFLSSETVFSLAKLPPRLAVIGAGPIGCELAQMFSRFGSVVTLLDRSLRVLPKEDRDAAEVVQAALQSDGVALELGSRVERVTRGRGVTLVQALRNGQQITIACDQVLVAVGRSPNVEGLGLEEAGVAYSPSGIQVNDRLRTTNRRIYAVGDVWSPHQFTHAADAQARLVLANALFFGRGRHSRLRYPRCTYTSPELAQVGLTSEEAARQGQAVDTITIPFREVDRAILEDQPDGFLRVFLRPGSDRVLGVTIVHEEAGDLIAAGAVAIQSALGLEALGRTIHPYPTLAEAYRKAADALRRRKLTPTVRRLLSLRFRIPG